MVARVCWGSARRGARQQRSSAGTQGTGALGRLSGSCERNGMKMRGGGPFYISVSQLKGLLEAEEPLEDKFRYDCEIYVLHYHISCKIKIK